jgi:Protein of unknown function (DUF2905)
MGRILIAVGIVLVVAGVLVTMGVRIGRLPGDVVVRGRNTVFYFPIVTCILASIVLSLVLWLLGRR